MPLPVLIDDPDEYFWNYDEIYIGVGSSVTQVHATKVNDLVLKWDEGIFQVTAIDGGTLVPTLEYWNPSENAGGPNSSIITSLSGYQPTVINRAFLYINGATRNITIDARYTIPGGDAIGCKLFKGLDTSAATGIVVSSYGVGTLVPLTAVDPGFPNIKRPPTFTVNSQIADGETVTLVSYTSAGRVIGAQTFLVVESTAFHASNVTTKVISDITLNASQYITTPDNDLLVVPANVQLNFAGFTATLHYTDGSTLGVPINGSNCKILGTENFNNNLLGSVTYLNLIYYASNSEYVQNGGANRSISHIYRIETDEDALSDSYKVYLSVKYNKFNENFNFEFYLGDTEYSPLVKLDVGMYDMTNESGAPYNLSKAYHLTHGFERMLITVYLENVFPERYDNYRISQQIDLDLNDVYSTNNTWLIDYDMDGSEMVDGAYKFKTVYPYTTLDIFNLAANQSLWLDRLYYSISPIVVSGDPVPTPTHFRLEYIVAEDLNNSILAQNHVSEDISIADWNDPYTPGDVTWLNLSTVNVIWLKDNGPSNAKLELGITPVLIVGGG